MWLRGIARYPSALPLAWAILTQIQPIGHLQTMKMATRKGSDKYSFILAGHIKHTPKPDSAREAIKRLRKLCDAISRAVPECLALNQAFSAR